MMLETERLILRPPAVGDAELQFRLLNTPVLMAHIGGVKTLAKSRSGMLRSPQASRATGSASS